MRSGPGYGEVLVGIWKSSHLVNFDTSLVAGRSRGDEGCEGREAGWEYDGRGTRAEPPGGCRELVRREKV